MKYYPRSAMPLLALLFSMSAMFLRAEPIELLKNGGFETVTDNVPSGWEPRNAGVLASIADPRTGKLAAKWEWRPHEWGYAAMCLNQTYNLVSIDPKGIYRASVWAKGTGTVSLAIYQRSHANFIVTEFLKGSLALTPEWRKLECAYKPSDNPNIALVSFAIQLVGQGAVAILDDASLTFDPAENPGIVLEVQKEAKHLLTFAVQSTNAVARVFVDGKVVPLAAGAGSIEIGEGIHAIAVQAEATGPQPGVRVALPEHPETDGRWRVATNESKAWMDVGFDDRTWSLVGTNADGFAWSPDSAAKAAFSRQIILWNATHYGSNRCIEPPAKEWGFAQKGMETFHHALYSPLPYALDDYEFILDLPRGFRLLDKQGYEARYILNNRPQKITTEAVRHNGEDYTRYRFAHPSNELPIGPAQYSMLPVAMDRKLPIGQSCRFYYRRCAKGNFTELEQFIPVTVLPPVRGKIPQHILIGYYASLGYSTMSKEHIRALVKQEAAAGLNACFMEVRPAWGESWRATEQTFIEAVADAGGGVILWPAESFPLNYGIGDWGNLHWYHTWFNQTPMAHGRYFNNQPPWGGADGKDRSRQPYCNEYVLSKEGAVFWDLVRREFACQLEYLGKAAKGIWTDWEFDLINKDGTGTHCFCDRCKQAFARHAHLPDTTDLGDEAILKNHLQEWLAFRNYQDGEIQRHIREVSNSLGMPYILYARTESGGLWKECQGKIDIPFPGWPGFSVADGSFQKNLDDAATSFQQMGFRQVIGQRFSLHTNSGYIEAKSWKSEILRIIASFHYGLSLAEGSNPICAGMSYWIGEATRIISRYEDIFLHGERADALASSPEIGYPNLLVLRKGGERLVLLFNESDKPLCVNLANKEVAEGQVAVIYDQKGKIRNPSQMQVTVPPADVAVVHIR